MPHKVPNPQAEFESIFKALTEQHSEEVIAEQHKEVVIREQLAESIRLLQERNEDVSAAAAEKARILDGVQGTMTRIDEITADPMLQIIEPIAGIFDANFSRRKLGRKLESDEMKMRLIDKRASLREAKRTAAGDVALGKIRQAEFEAAAEKQDVTALRQRASDITTVMEQMSAAEEKALAAASEEELQAVATGKTPEKQAKFSAAAAERGLLERASQKLGVEISTLNAEAGRQSRLTQKIQSVDDAELREMHKSGEITTKQFNAEQERLRLRELALTSAEQAVREGDDKALARATVALRNSMTNEERDKAILQASETGVATFKVGNQTISMSITDLQKDKEAVENVFLQQATDRVIGETATVGVLSAARGAARSTGQPQASGLPADVETRHIFETLSQDDTLPIEVRNQAAVANSLIKQATEAEARGLDQQANSLRLMAQKTATSVTEKAQASKLEVTPKAQKPAMTEYISRGIVTSQENASAAVVSSLLTGFDRNTGSGFYNQALATVRQSEKLVANQEVTRVKHTDPEAFFSILVANPQVRAEAATRATDVAVADLFDRVALLLGDEQLAGMLRNSGSALFTPSGALSQRQLFQFLQERPKSTTGVTLDEFVSKMRSEARAYFDTVTNPGGDTAAVQASVNSLFFENEATAYMLNELNTRIHEALRPPTPRGVRRPAPPGTTEIFDALSIGP